MQGVILAAGKGKRLHPITLTRSKAMAPILGKPIVERVMDQLATNGITDFVIVTSPDDKEIVHYFRHHSKIEAQVRFAQQPERLGMANAVQCAVPLLTDDFVLSACDNLTSTGHVGRMLAAWQAPAQPNGVLTLMPVEPDRLGSVGIVEMDGPWVSRIIEKPDPAEAPSDISSLPLYIFARRILDYLPEVPLSPRGEYELQDAIQMLIERNGRVGGVTIRKRLTLTNPSDLLAINQRYLLKDVDLLELGADSVGPNTQFIAPVYVEAGTIIGRDSTIGPNVYIEQDCHIGNGVAIQDAVLLRGTRVPHGTTIKKQVLSETD